jgi:hypothetical protein
MLANFLEKSKPINFIIYLGFFLCFFFIATTTTYFNEGFSWIKVLDIVGFFVLFLTIFFFFNFITTKNKLTFDHSYAFFIFILISILFVSKLLDFNVLILLLIHLLFLRKIYSLRSSKSIIQKLFDSGFWLGILFILEPFSIVFFLLIIVSIILQHKVTISNVITPVVGFITPLIIYFTYLFWYDSIDVFIALFSFDVAFPLLIYAEDATIWIFGILLLLCIFSIFLKSPKALSVNNSFKRSWQLLIINLTLAIVYALLIKNKDGSEVIFLGIPASLIIANGFEIIEKKLMKNMLLFGLLILTTIGFFWL